MYGFSEEDVEELAMQGIKPWDPEGLQCECMCECVV